MPGLETLGWIVGDYEHGIVCFIFVLLSVFMCLVDLAAQESYVTQLFRYATNLELP
jgi:hypothetical protein